MGDLFNNFLISIAIELITPPGSPKMVSQIQDAHEIPAIQYAKMRTEYTKLELANVYK